MKNKPHTLKWFLNRLGKTVYRDDVSCPCPTCKKGTTDGIVIGDKQHAEYLHLIETSHDMGVNYRDKK